MVVRLALHAFAGAQPLEAADSSAAWLGGPPQQGSPLPPGQQSAPARVPGAPSWEAFAALRRQVRLPAALLAPSSQVACLVRECRA